MKFKSIIKKASRLFLHYRFQPVRVFCLHHVCDVYNPLVFFEGDWMSIERFIAGVKSLKRKYTFISLEDAYEKINKDFFRFKKYAVLTFDDGYRSSLHSFRWLESQGIPYTLFLNSKYLDGKTVSPHLASRAESLKVNINSEMIAEGLYLTPEDLGSLSVSLASFGSHGYEHLDANALSSQEFDLQIELAFSSLAPYQQTIPFHAFTWGRHSEEKDQQLLRKKIVPVLMDGQANYGPSSYIHRELFPTIN